MLCLQPIHTAMGNSPGVWEAAPTACAVVICFASCIGSINRLECEHRRKVCSVSGDVMLSRTGDATSICAITAPHSLPFALAASLKLAFENREVPKVFYFRAHLSAASLTPFECEVPVNGNKAFPPSSVRGLLQAAKQHV